MTLDFNFLFQTEIMRQITASWCSQNEATLTFSEMRVDPISFEESFRIPVFQHLLYLFIYNITELGSWDLKMQSHFVI